MCHQYDRTTFAIVRSRAVRCPAAGQTTTDKGSIMAKGADKRGKEKKKPKAEKPKPGAGASTVTSRADEVLGGKKPK